MNKSMTRTSNEDHQTQVKEVAAARMEAAKNLQPLFCSVPQGAPGHPGRLLHKHGISGLKTLSLEWGAFMDRVAKDPNARYLAFVAAGAENPDYPPALVAELFDSRVKEDGGGDNGWLVNVFFPGIQQIFRETGRRLCASANHEALDIRRSAYNLIFESLDQTERKRLGISEDGTSRPARILSADPMEIAGEGLASLDYRSDPIQLVANWARSFRISKNKKKNSRSSAMEGTGGSSPDTSSDLLPRVVPKEAAVMAAASDPNAEVSAKIEELKAEMSAAVAVENFAKAAKIQGRIAGLQKKLEALSSETAPSAPSTPEAHVVVNMPLPPSSVSALAVSVGQASGGKSNDEIALLPPPPAVPAVPQQASSAVAAPPPQVSVVNKEVQLSKGDQLILDALASSPGLQGKSMVALVNRGKKSMAEAIAFATEKNLL